LSENAAQLFAVHAGSQFGVYKSSRLEMMKYR